MIGVYFVFLFVALFVFHERLWDYNRGFRICFNLVQELVLQDAMHWAVPTDAIQLRRLTNKNN